MANTFCFRSPARPLCPKTRHDLRQKAKVCKRRQQLKMNTPPELACVARVNEPVFCPSALAGLVPYYDLNILTWSTSGSNAGVLSQDRSDQVTRNDDARSNVPPLGSDPTLQERSVLASQASQRLYHPRPEPLDIAQEEDRGRIRFALEDENDSTALLQRLLHLSPVRHDADCLAGSEWDDRLQLERLAGSEQVSGGTPSLTSLPLVYVTEVDVDALAVDDPQRSYDFKIFMEACEADERSVTKAYRLGLSVHTLLSSSQDDVARDDVETGNTDIQGLRWEASGFSRELVLERRKARHPSGQGLQPYGDEMNTTAGTTPTTEVQYRFKSFSPRHRAQYSHFQLRNVLAAANRNEIFYAKGSRVMQTSLACSSFEKPIMDLSATSTSLNAIKITCLATTSQPQDFPYRSDRVLVAGGWDGEFAMLDLNAESGSSIYSDFVTHDYNGLVTHVSSYHDRHGMLQACFCLNDQRVRILDVKTQHFVSSFSYDNAINCSALSPDGRLRVLVGDSNDALIIDAEKGDTLLTLQAHKDHGFACAWSDDGRHVATGAQDGLVVLWDSRDWSKPVWTMDCVMSTARSLHFTSDGALVVGEDDDVVTIYDTKRPDERQDIRFLGSIAGIALLDNGDELIIANADRTVGGLMSFQRTPQGLNGVSFGESMDHPFINCEWKGERCTSSSRNGRQRSDIVSEMVV